MSHPTALPPCAAFLHATPLLLTHPEQQGHSDSRRSWYLPPHPDQPRASSQRQGKTDVAVSSHALSPWQLAEKASWELAKEHPADDMPSSEKVRKEVSFHRGCFGILLNRGTQGEEGRPALEEVEITKEEREELVGGLAEA